MSRIELTPPATSMTLLFLNIAFLLLGLLGLIFWIQMLIDAATKETDSTNKIVWILVILFLNFLGALIYRFARKGPRDAANKGVRVG
jgi:hypothetical protein